MKTKTKAILVISAILLVSSIVGFLYFSGEEEASTKSVETVYASRGNLVSSVTATGIVIPKAGAEVKVGSRISGQLKQLKVEVGTEVKESDTIAELGKEDLEAQVSKAEAEWEIAVAELDSILAGARPEEVKQAEANLNQAEASLKVAESDLQRYKSLYENEAISQQQLEQKQEDRETAFAKFIDAQQRLSLIENKYTEQDIQKAQAKVKQAEAVLNNAKVQLSYATIRSPIPGMVASVTTQEGETVAAGNTAPTFVTIVDLNRLQVNTYVDETDIGKVEIGQKAKFTVESYMDKEFAGTVTAIAPKSVVENSVVYYIVTVSIDDTQKLLKPDMTANVNIVTEEKKDILSIPSKAIKRENGKKIVYVINKEKIEAKTVKTGWSDHSVTEILEGLNEGDEVVTSDIGLNN